MLVLGRKLGEEIKIAGDITVKVVGIKGKSIRLGIDAPKHVRVLRGELEAEFDLPIDLENYQAHVPTNRLLAGGYLEY